MAPFIAGFFVGVVSTCAVMKWWAYGSRPAFLEEVWADLLTVRCLIRTRHIAQVAAAAMKAEARRHSIPPWMSQP